MELKKIDLRDIATNSVVLCMGRRGCGKTTFVQKILAYKDADNGIIFVPTNECAKLYNSMLANKEIIVGDYNSNIAATHNFLVLDECRNVDTFKRLTIDLTVIATQTQLFSIEFYKNIDYIFMFIPVEYQEHELYNYCVPVLEKIGITMDKWTSMLANETWGFLDCLVLDVANKEVYKY